jgi:hypothetical protein
MTARPNSERPSSKWPSFARTLYWRYRQRSESVIGWSELAERIYRDAEHRGPLSLAIVGNAGYLADLHQGAKIDECDLVLRMNNCQVKGYERNVGYSTDIYMSNFYYDIDFSNPSIEDARYHISSRPNVFRKSRKTNILQRFGEHITEGMLEGKIDLVYAPESELFSQWCQTLEREPTTGFMAIMLALETLSRVIDHVYVTGFSFFEGKSHYFSDATVDPFHSVATERDLICRRLREEAMETGRFTFDPILSQKLGLEDNDRRRIAI